MQDLNARAKSNFEECAQYICLDGTVSTEIASPTLPRRRQITLAEFVREIWDAKHFYELTHQVGQSPLFGLLQDIKLPELELSQHTLNTHTQ